ncbi:hypothetical protein CCR95_08560 [Thiocystis minor]|uniref:DUF1902 domain-containing protein n=1 Tax=Thiocystis minor TaxID=61597 RepID=UPI001914617B|nr:DUF1902 domain-containing protein [Thiocystis minor]MBK5964135.1 hypothetical protein [Thiocystis minor]
MHYEIHVEWDAEAQVWYIENSNVPGLVGEAPTLETMMTLLQTRVPEMLAENGCPTDDEIPLRLLTTSHLAQLRQVA